MPPWPRLCSSSVRFHPDSSPVSISLSNERRKWRMDEPQWRGMRGVGSGTSRLEVERQLGWAAVVQTAAVCIEATCSTRRSGKSRLLQLASRSLALLFSPSISSLPLSFSFSLLPSSFLSFFLSLSLSLCFSLSLSLSVHASPFLFSLSLSFSLSVPPCVRRTVPYPPVVVRAPFSSAHSSSSVHLSVLFLSDRFSARERARPRFPLAASLSVLVLRPTATWPCYGGVPDTRVDFVNVVVRYVLPRIPVPRLE